MNDYATSEECLRDSAAGDSPHSAMSDWEIDRAIAKIKAEAIREAASGLVDWDIIYGNEAGTVEARESNKNAAYLMVFADQLEERAL